ncbi:MAG: UDP-N-acetylglucosamine 1-carboxyvinyltransferase [Flavobacteriaceae bacterium]|jgi:UDP-N-acetylglucosamine 1-carboxyvinyltransferase
MKTQEKIGALIKKLRKDEGMTQKDFALALATSQSAVARMERGGQNFSTKELRKISKILKHPIVSVSNNTTNDFIIRGGKKLSGSIRTNPSKNGAMGLICAALLNKGTTILHNIPRIEEIARMIEFISSMKISIEWVGTHSLKIKVPNRLSFKGMDIEAARKMRSSIMTIGALSHRTESFSLPYAGGCKMGERTISAHSFGMQPLGVSVKIQDHAYQISSKLPKRNIETTLYEASDTATENILIRAALIPQTTTIHFGQLNYMVQDVIGFLRVCGVEIETTGTAIIVKGLESINNDIEYYNSEDPIESMAFITAGIVTQSEITVMRCPLDFLRLELVKLKRMGLKYALSQEYFSDNGFTKLVDITVYPSHLKALADKIHPLPYPGINVDNLPFFVPIASLATGRTLIHDWMWEHRAIYFTELNRLGADITLADPHRVFVDGVAKLRPAEIVCPPALRPSMIIFIAMLAAEGESTLRNVYAVKRGYEDIHRRLNALGADITLIRRP